MQEDKLLNFDDVLIEPIFSNVRSRKDVNLVSEFLGQNISLPIVNSNMDTVSSPELCKALANYGTIGTLHRFWDIETNIQAFVNSTSNGIKPFVSVGITDGEFERAKALYSAGAEIFILDVAHAANLAVVEFYNKLTKEFPNAKYIVGDFGTGKEIHEFIGRVNRIPDAVKVGIGIGSVCHTRLVTGVGNYSLSCLFDCAEALEQYEIGIKLVLDGGVHEIGDIAKALVAGADLIISGSMFAGTDETPGEIFADKKEYRGSASLKSYEVQGKVADWRAPEGKAIWIDRKGPVLSVLNNINGGLRSSCSYVNAFNLNELRANAKFRFVK